MNRPLSFSSYKRMLTCPKYYEYNDILGQKAGGHTSALYFGTAVGDAVEHFLKTGECPMEFYCLNSGDMIDKEMEYYPDDFDADLIDLVSLEGSARALGWKGDDVVKLVKDMLKDQANLSKNQRELLSVACWSSLNAKAMYMIEGFQKWVYPKIKEVHDVQRHLVSEEGDLHGYLDFTCTLNDGRKVLIDLKTAKMSYDPDAVLYSAQLALYAAIHNYEYAGFVVMSKQISKQKTKTCVECGHVIKGGNAKTCTKRVGSKRCGSALDIQMNPKSFVQLLVDKVPKHNKDLTLTAMRDTIKLIDNGVFPRNLGACNYMYGRPCPYRETCWNRKIK